MSRFARAYAAAAVTFLALDAAWLSWAASRLYRPALGSLMREDFDFVAAGLFYPLYLAALVYFVIVPATGVRHAAARGAFFGLVAYATYDLTNQATLRGWPWHITAIDLAWGAFVTAVACAAAAAFAKPRS